MGWCDYLLPYLTPYFLPHGPECMSLIPEDRKEQSEKVTFEG